MLEGKIRPAYDRMLIEPFAKHLAVSPSSITISALISGVLVFPALLFRHAFLASFLLIASGYLDTLDGAIARSNATNSARGTCLDIIADRVVEIAVVFALYAVSPSTRGWLSLGILASIMLCVTSFLLVGIFTENNQAAKGFHYSVGIIERPEAFLFFIAMILLPNWFHVLAYTFITLVLLTTIIRIAEFFKNHALS